jgi:O-acetyl-ADP-ribose deacetylase
MERKIGKLTLQVLAGDIASQADIECVVNAANAQLRPGGGVAGAIHRAAGPGLDGECRPLAPIRPGEAVLTGGHNLPNRHVIHCLGPVYGVDRPERELLANCYLEALRLAEEAGIGSVAFPSISTGAFGYPMEDAARAAFETILRQAPRLRRVRLVRFVLYGEAALAVHRRVLDVALQSKAPEMPEGRDGGAEAG